MTREEAAMSIFPRQFVSVTATQEYARPGDPAATTVLYALDTSGDLWRGLRRFGTAGDDWDFTRQAWNPPAGSVGA